MNKDYLLSKISNFKELRNHCNVIMLALIAILGTLFIEHTMTLKLVVIAIICFISGLIEFLRYNHYNRLINKYMEKLKNEYK